MSDLLIKAQPYINYQDELLAKEGDKGFGSEKFKYVWALDRDNACHKEDENYKP